MDTAQVLAYLHAQRDRIVNAIAALEAMGWTAAVKLTNSTTTKAATPAAVNSAKAAQAAFPAATKRVISPEARQRMAEAQKKRYAKAKRAVKATAKKAAVVVSATEKPAKAAPIASAVKGARKPMSAATKEKLALAAKERWAAKKAPAKKAAKKSAPVATA